MKSQSKIEAKLPVTYSSDDFAGDHLFDANGTHFCTAKTHEIAHQIMKAVNEYEALNAIAIAASLEINISKRLLDALDNLATVRKAGK